MEFVDEVAGVYFRAIVLQKGDEAQQHVHPYDHATLIGSGAATLYVNGEARGMHYAGEAVLIKANEKHSFIAHEHDTRLICVHIAASAEKAKEIPCPGA